MLLIRDKLLVEWRGVIDAAEDRDDVMPRCCCCCWWWCARSIVTEGVEDIRDGGCWCAEGIDLTEAEDERTVTSSDAGSPLVPVRPERDETSGDAPRDCCAACAAWAAMCASSSCSCCRALTNAALSRLVCSALSAFLTLEVTQASQITFTSLPAKEHCCQNDVEIPVSGAQFYGLKSWCNKITSIFMIFLQVISNGELSV